MLSNLSWRRPLVLRFHLAALKGDKQQLNQVVVLAKGMHGAKHCAASRAMDLALLEGQRETAACCRAA